MIYDGIVDLDDSQVSVIVGFEENGIRLSAGGAEIGEWRDGEYRIDHRGDGVYAITAENETLRFLPADPGLFAAHLEEAKIVVVQAEPPKTPGEARHAAPPTPPPSVEAPPPRPLTRVAFYALAALTAGLGLWALTSLFVG